MGRRKRNNKYASNGRIDMTGTRCHRWLVLRCAGKERSGQYTWECQCDCGNISVVRGGDLRSGASQSCGCWAVKRASKHLHKDDEYPQRAGQSKNPLYWIWRSLIQRVGIYKRREGYSVCKSWWEGSDQFLIDLKNLGWKKGDELVLQVGKTEYGPNTIRVAPRGTTRSILETENHPELRDMEGKQFGHLKVLKSYSKKGKWVCDCQCDCGNTSTHFNTDLVSGRLKTCGCRYGGKWSMYYEKCAACSRTNRPHHSRGICSGCRARLMNNKQWDLYKASKKPYKNHA